MPHTNTSSDNLLLACGPELGTALTPPPGVRVTVTSPLEAAPSLDFRSQQELLQRALIQPESGPPLRELAKGHRRVAVVVGDLSLPAPYDIVLPLITQTLQAAEIRPTRITFLAAPGNGAPLLGRAAIARYGEEIVGEHDVLAWNGAGNEADPAFAAADLKLAIAPRVFARGPQTLLPPGLKFDFGLELQLGRKSRIDIVAANSGADIPVCRQSASTSRQECLLHRPQADVFLTSGGGAPWESTLEEALLSLHSELSEGGKSPAQTAVLAFNGSEGLGAARFTRELWDLLPQAEELLQQKNPLPQTELDARYFDPALTVAAALAHFQNLVLFAPEFIAHEDGDDLRERVAQHPALAARILFASSTTELWQHLHARHGDTYQITANPLGWREGAH